MGCPTSKSHPHNQSTQVPSPQDLFKTDLKKQHKRYVQIVLYMRSSKIFQKKTDLLQKQIQQYISNNFKFDPTNMNIASIDSVIKLHPIDCKKPQILTKQWILDACLRQDKFCKQTKVQRVTFEHAYPEYLSFLKLCKQARGTKKITVPTKCQDIIWHSHMQDVQNYQSDMRKHIGFFLNHRDDYPKEDLEKYTKDTWQRKGLQYNFKQQKSQNKQIQAPA